MSQVVRQSSQPTVRCQCQHCRTVFKIGSTYVGQIVNCPKCTNAFEVAVLSQTLRAKPTQEQMAMYDSMIRPFQVGLGAWLGGPLAGGGMIAWNFHRLGKRFQAILAMLAAIVVYVFVLAILLYASDFGASSRVQTVPNSIRVMSLIILLTQAAVCFAFTHSQWDAIWKLDELPPARFRTSGKITLYVMLTSFAVSIGVYFLLLGL